MDFDEYEYLEKTVENPEAIKDTSGLEDNGRAVPAGGQDDKERIRRSNRRSDEDGHSVQHGSKRARSEEDSRERERERSERTADQRHGRGSSHRGYPPQYRSRNLDTVEKIRYKSSRERDTDHDRERTDRNGMYKDREKTKRDGDRDRDNLRDRDCESKREVDRERSRRSRGLSERRCSSEHHCTDKESNPEREQDSGDRELKERERKLNERERERELREKDDRCFKERKEEAPEAEADPERDQRTVFAYQICLKANEKDVYEFFSRAGKVRDVQLIMDRNSRRSKGVGYIEFYDAMSVPMAIALSGQLLHGQPVMIKPSEAEKNLVQSNAAVAGGPGGFIGPNSGGARRLYVGNLHFNITEDQLRQVFEPFGNVELVQLPTVPETGQCKGFGFVQFMRLEDARAAQSLNGQLEIAGRIIKVSALSDQAGMQDLGANAGDFDDDDGGGISLNARSRAILMQKLDRSTATSVAGSVATTSLANPSLSLPRSAVPSVFPVAAPIAPTLGSAAIPGYMGLQSSMLAPPAVAPLAVDIIGVPSDCLLLKNMFDPKNETESDFDVDIKEDVHDECSKFGTVKHIFVDKYSAGHVYLCFDSVTSAVGAQCALHGRWFAGKMITAIYMPSSSYWEKFSDSK